MQGQTFQYDPSQVILTIGDAAITGFAAGTKVKVARNKDAFTTVVGTDGEGTRVKSVDLSGTITCTLQQSSPSNDYLSALATQDERSSDAYKPIYLKDKNGTTLAKCKAGWIKKKPDSEFADALENREWVVETVNLQYDVGGETEIGV